jgi:hypothetical protein
MQEHLTTREDNLRALRSILREVSKVLRADLDLLAFVRGLLKQSEPLLADGEVKEHVFRCITDLVCVCLFLAVSLYARLERKDISQVGIFVLEDFVGELSDHFDFFFLFPNITG